MEFEELAASFGYSLGIGAIPVKRFAVKDRHRDGGKSRRDIVLADDATTFSESVVRLLRDEPLRRRYEKSAAALAVQYDWATISEKFLFVLRSLAGGVPRMHRQYVSATEV